MKRKEWKERTEKELKLFFLKGLFLKVVETSDEEKKNQTNVKNVNVRKSFFALFEDKMNMMRVLLEGAATVEGVLLQ